MPLEDRFTAVSNLFQDRLNTASRPLKYRFKTTVSSPVQAVSKRLQDRFKTIFKRRSQKTASRPFGSRPNIQDVPLPIFHVFQGHLRFLLSSNPAVLHQNSDEGAMHPLCHGVAVSTDVDVSPFVQHQAAEFRTRLEDSVLRSLANVATGSEGSTGLPCMR